NWLDFDSSEDIGRVRVPFRLTRADEDVPTGTSLHITDLSPQVRKLHLDDVRTASIEVLSRYQSLLQQAETEHPAPSKGVDPGFDLKITPTPPGSEDDSVAGEILQAAVLRAVLRSDGVRLTLDGFRRGTKQAVTHITDAYPSSAG